MTDVHTITNMLREVRGGTPDAVDRLMCAVYPELHNIARRAMSHERIGHTLQPTALLHEAYLKLFKPADQSKPVPAAESQEQWKNRAHFFAIAAHQMRHILVDHARKNKGKKRDGGPRISLNEEIDSAPERGHAIEDIDTLLSDLESKDPRAARVVELKFFGGLTDDEVVETTGSNRARVRRDWEFARAWLLHQLDRKKSS